MGLRDDPAFKKAQDKAKEASAGALPLTKGWLKAKDRDLVEVPFKVHGARVVHKDLSYWPSGDPNPAHDEVMLAIEFRDNSIQIIEALPQDSKFPVVEIGEIYGISTKAKIIVDTFKWMRPEQLPIEDACFREDLTAKPFTPENSTISYYPLYIDDFYASGFPSEEAAPSPFDQDRPQELILEDPSPSSSGREGESRSTPSGPRTGRGTGRSESPQAQAGKPQDTGRQASRVQRSR